MTSSSSSSPSSSSSGTPTYVARSALDLVALVPVVLGFHPTDSVVLLTFGAAAGSFHARVDASRDPAEQQELGDVLARAVRRHRVPVAAVLVYSADQDLAEDLAMVVVGRLLDEDCSVIDALRVDDGRFHALPDDGTPGTTYDLSRHPITAAHVFAGEVVQADRAEVARGLEPVEDEAGRADTVEVTLAATRVADRLVDPLPGSAGGRLGEEATWLRARVRRHVEHGGVVGPADAGRLLVLASVGHTREAAWRMMGRSSPAYVELWRDLLRRAPRDLRPGAASLLAFAAWLRGDGALAWCALDRAYAVDPDHPPAHEVAGLLQRAESPLTWVPPDPPSV